MSDTLPVYWYEKENEIQQICKPLFDNSFITTFAYEYYFYDGRYCSLGTQLFGVHHYIEKKLYPQASTILCIDTGWLIFSPLIEVPLSGYAKRKYNEGVTLDIECYGIKHRAIFAKKHNDGIESYTFGCPGDSSDIISKYLSCMSYLETFIAYFNIKAKKLIQAVKQKPIQLADFNDTYDNQILDTKSEYFNVRKFLDELSKNTLIIDHLHQPITLKANEAQCIKHLLNGFTSKQIAKLTNLSPASVDTYIENIKNKFHLTSRHQLREIFSDYKVLLEKVDILTS